MRWGWPGLGQKQKKVPGQGRVCSDLSGMPRPAPPAPHKPQSQQRWNSPTTSLPQGLSSFPARPSGSFWNPKGCPHSCTSHTCCCWSGPWRADPRSAAPPAPDGWHFGLSLCWSVYLVPVYFFISVFQVASLIHACGNNSNTEMTTLLTQKDTPSKPSPTSAPLIIYAYFSIAFFFFLPICMYLHTGLYFVLVWFYKNMEW